MYLPQHFALPTDDAVELAGRVGVGHLVTITQSRAESTLVPFLIDRRDDVLSLVTRLTDRHEAGRTAFTRGTAQQVAVAQLME